MMNHSRLREALSKPPAGYVPPKPTSVPVVISLEEILTRAQNRHRTMAPARATFFARFRRWGFR